MASLRILDKPVISWEVYDSQVTSKLHSLAFLDALCGMFNESFITSNGQLVNIVLLSMSLLIFVSRQQE